MDLIREQALEQLEGRSFDLLVIGGGIIGAGIAAHAARAGLAVALVERADFGSATSSASSKLIHGGLRYLRLGDFRLVREAHAERRALMRVVAPHLVRPLPFLLPLYENGPYRPGTIRAGLGLYSLLAREGLQGLVEPERARARVPDLRLDGLRACGVYFDAWTHDTRLCLANLRAAADAGAVVLNYAELVALRIAKGRVAGADVCDRIEDASIAVTARAVVNATGPWVDGVRRLEDDAVAPSSRLSKGVHVLLRPERPWSAALTIPLDTVRVSFALPWEGMLMLGTTDTLYEGEPGAVEATGQDVDRVLAEASLALDCDLVRHANVRFAFAGLRVLPGAGAETAGARRETVFLRGRAGMLSVAGGKLTTYRRIALETLRTLRPELGLHRIDDEPFPLPGADELGEAAKRLAERYPDVDPSIRSHLAHLYGGLAEDVLAESDDDDLFARLHPDAPDIAAQVLYARKHEWACKAEDVVRRRTTLAQRGLDDPSVVSRVEALLRRAAP